MSKAIIDCIQKGVSLSQLIAVIALISILIALSMWLNPFLQELLIGSSRIVRMRYAIKAFRKNLNTDYVQIESFAGREMNKRAAEFYKSNFAGSANFIECANQLFVCIFGIITSLTLLYKINILVILLILSTCIGEFFLLKHLNKMKEKVKDERNSFFLKFDYFYSQSQNVEASKDIRLYSFSDYFIKILAELLSQLNKIISYYMGQSLYVNGTRALLNMGREIAAYAYLIFLVTTGRLSVSDFIFYFSIITGFSHWIMGFVTCISVLEKICIDCEKYREFVDSDNTLTENAGINLDSVSSIEFKNVYFKYTDAEKDTIADMSFKVSAGENIAIVGENGAGKTTAVKLLCGLYYPTGGEILINGVDNKQINIQSYFQLFSPIFQDYRFLPMTIAQNISASIGYDADRLFFALEKAGIKEKIDTLENKENTYMIKDVYKNAADFSGGEKQKLLLAKAIYKDAPVLILDEPTASLDPIAENELYLKYDELTRNKISFFISHRLSSTRFCDRILFISDGRITEEGTHEELMQKKGKYYRMFQLQSYYYNEQDGVVQ
ncbi:MAG: ABC transporter ATP-binding protein [Clostridia bacterium]|nr:ABC transporter ATP-binding protein [Clostridia bacterium]MBQ7046574.1 ABC transporter ATP-binding protein [Oscillospiraceae bacterium]